MPIGRGEGAAVQPEDEAMSRATGTFEVTGWRGMHDELEGGIELTHASGTQTFKGDIDAQGAVHWLMLYRADKSAHFVGCSASPAPWATDRARSSWPPKATTRAAHPPSAHGRPGSGGGDPPASGVAAACRRPGAPTALTSSSTRSRTDARSRSVSQEQVPVAPALLLVEAFLNELEPFGFHRQHLLTRR